MGAPQHHFIAAIGGLAVLAGAASGQAAFAQEPGETFADCADCPEMVVVPAGGFVMGSPEGEDLRDPDEGLHEVTFAAAFAVGKYPVTWDEWTACVQDNWCEGQAVETALRTDLNGEPIRPYTDHGRGTRPVVGMSWWDAQEFVGWLNAKSETGGYRLLTESEWEYAARAGTTSAYPWGEAPDHDYANFGLMGEGLGGEAAGRDVWVDETSPVGSFPPNDFGLYDMHGNTYEWVEDCYQADASLLPTDGSAVKDGNCSVRVMRSTSFTSNPHTLRSANRAGQYPPNLRGRNYLSFRVAKDL
ncbi:MAG: formylglycine-generating enzyme family protein [Maricaulaceae bacterium]|jgi:formylglycine-generating enzyme required for sulfatase activity